MGEVKKEYRDKVDKRKEICLEAGDTLFYLVALLDKYELTIEDCMRANEERLTHAKFSSNKEKWEITNDNT